MKHELTKYIRGRGIEIGALNNPLQVEEKKAKVLYVDFLDLEFLAKSNPETKEADIEKPDINADAEDLSKIASGSQDFVILCHVLEHIPNPLKALKEIYRVLKADGIFYLSIPDKRYSFDKEREVTTIAHMIRDFKMGITSDKCIPHYKEWLELVELKKEKPVAKTVDELIRGGYRIHYHVFLPESILGLIEYSGIELGVSFKLKNYYFKNGDLNVVFIFKKSLRFRTLPKYLKERYSWLDKLLPF